jgi:peroxiredoxin (alkyl hydroperoxide reductase subunit C)
MPLNVGDTAPDFSLMDPNRQTVSLSDFKGERTVVLAFYPLAFTLAARWRCPASATSAATSRPRTPRSWASASTPSPHRAPSVREIKANFPLLSDWPKYNTARAYGVFRDAINIAARVTYVIDKEGIIRGVIESESDMEVHSRDALKLVKELA